VRSISFCFCLIFLSGCSYTGEKRGFVYKTPLIEFACSHEPSKIDIKIDKEDLAKIIGAAIPKSRGIQGQEDHSVSQEAEKLAPKVEKLVQLCQQLIKGEAI